MSYFNYELGMNPKPKPAPDATDITECVISDISKRKDFGAVKYEQPSLLEPNGRNFLIDLYEELLDAAQYTRGQLEAQAREAQERNSDYWERQSKLQCLVVDLLGCVAFDEENEFLQITNRSLFIRHIKAIKELTPNE